MEARVRARDVTRVLIRRAHARARRQVGYLTGGPVRYTGQPMAVSTSTSARPPSTFMADAAHDGRAAHRRGDAGRARPHSPRPLGLHCSATPSPRTRSRRRPPDGDSVYAHAGGVPARAAATLVDLGVEARRPRATTPGSRARATRRLKYLLTELVAEGGAAPRRRPPTPRRGQARREGRRVEKFFRLPARGGADVERQRGRRQERPRRRRRAQARALPRHARRRRRRRCARAALRAAGYSVVQTTAALLESDGDKDKASRCCSPVGRCRAENPLPARARLLAAARANAGAPRPPRRRTRPAATATCPSCKPANEVDAVKTLAGCAAPSCR